MKRIYGFYRPEVIGSKRLNGVSQNGTYTMSFYADGQYGDWIDAGIVSIKDMEIPEERYTKEIIPGIKDLRRFAYLEYDEQYIEDTLALEVINKIGARFDLRMLSTEEALDFIRTHTDLVEESTGIFIIQEEIESMGEVINKKTLELG